MRGTRPALIAVVMLSGLLNLLYLTGSFYMLQIYDRVIPSRSIPSLVALSFLALILFLGQGFLDIIRTRILLRLSRIFDERLSLRLFHLIGRHPVSRGGKRLGVQPLRDLDQVRSFLASNAPTALLDLPWTPGYVAICFLFHPLIGISVLAGMALLVILTWATETLTRKPLTAAVASGSARMTLAEATRRNAEVVTAMGMLPSMARIWGGINQAHLSAHQAANDVSSTFGTVSKVSRLALQSAVLGLGAYLVITEQASAGAILASSILSARALAPIDQVIAHWKQFAGARQGWGRLAVLIAQAGAKADPILRLRAPSFCFSLENVALLAPATETLVVHDVSFRLERGQALGVVGASGSGKSSLARALVGVWWPLRGSVRLDGATLDQWSVEELGRHIGYLPQDIELFDGTIGENIARFYADAESDDIVAAAEMAGIHEMIVRLPNGYETRLGDGGVALSGGQRQRLGLARALYGNPFLVVLDEPNSNLDGEGEQALKAAIRNVKARGGVVVIVAHRPSVLAEVDFILVMAEGTVSSFGARDEVIRQLTHPIERQQAPRVMPRAS